jgi:hypothetical protein
MARQGLRQGPKKSGCGSVTVGTVGMLTGRYGTGAGGCCDVGPWVTVGWSRILCQVRKGFQVIYQYYEGLNHQNLGLNISVWWFQTCFIFHSIWDNPNPIDSYFSRWLKPPTRYNNHLIITDFLWECRIIIWNPPFPIFGSWTPGMMYKSPLNGWVPSGMVYCCGTNDI